MPYSAIESTILKRLTLIMEEFRAIDPEFPTQAASCFLYIARCPGITMKDLADEVLMSQSSVSRNVGALGKRHRYKKQPYGLVVLEEDPIDTRRKTAKLTPKGEKLIQKLWTIMGVEQEADADGKQNH